jgi:hypothetical protein
VCAAVSAPRLPLDFAREERHFQRLTESRSAMKPLPIGIQSFAKIRNENYLYVDKTEVIHRLITSGMPFFLSRPRRFGKSLLVSTLAEIFSGNEALFKGLAIHDKWDWSRKHPVVHLDWSGMRYHSVEELEIEYAKRILQIADDYQVKISSSKPEIFDLIRALYEKYNEQAVVLIDEYDKPIQDAIDNPARLGEIKETLHGIYNTLKACDPYLRFLFLTGVSKFAGISVFSTLNNLVDITLDGRYAAICGYTQAELEHYFPEYIERFAKKKNTSAGEMLSSIKEWYDGYTWDGKTHIYNPFSTLRLLDSGKFGNFWFNTGTPTFLVKILRKRNQLESVFGKNLVSSLDSMSDNPNYINEVVLLFQTGYLTIKETRELSSWEEEFALDFPNREVRESFVKALLVEYGKYAEGKAESIRKQLEAALLGDDAEALTEVVQQSIFAWVPHEIFEENEHYYQSILLLWLRLLGFEAVAEVSTRLGRADIIWELPEQIIVAELKYGNPTEKKVKGKPVLKPANLDRLLAAAHGQIKDKKYAERYKASGKKLTALAIACSAREVKCDIQAL